MDLDLQIVPQISCTKRRLVTFILLSQGGLGEGRTWDQISDSYDSELGLDETLMGIKLFRRWLVRQAKVRRAASTTFDISFDNIANH